MGWKILRRNELRPRGWKWTEVPTWPVKTAENSDVGVKTEDYSDLIGQDGRTLRLVWWRRTQESDLADRDGRNVWLARSRRNKLLSWPVNVTTIKSITIILIFRGHFFVTSTCTSMQRYVEDVKQDEKHVPDLLEAIMKPPGLVRKTYGQVSSKSFNLDPKSL